MRFIVVYKHHQSADEERVKKKEKEIAQKFKKVYGEGIEVISLHNNEEIQLTEITFPEDHEPLEENS